MPEPELIRRVVDSTGLSAAEAERLVGDVVAYYRETMPEFVRRRHHELKLHGMRNAQIFPAIAEETRVRVFAAEPVSERQLRRMIYT